MGYFEAHGQMIFNQQILVEQKGQQRGQHQKTGVTEKRRNPLILMGGRRGFEPRTR